MTKQEFQDRTKQFALDVFIFCNTLPKDQSCRIIANQLRRSASSVGANYRAACRGHSRAAFIYKLSIVEEEADECIFWLEMLEGLGVKRGKKIHILREEADQIVAMIVASKKTSRRGK